MTNDVINVEAVERLIDSGAGVGAVERLIDRLELDAEQKSALWLRAWSEAGLDHPRESAPRQYSE